MAGVGSPKFTSENNPGKGRPKGARSKKTILRERIQLLADSNRVDPVMLLLDFAGNTRLGVATRMRAAADAAPYVRRRLAPEASQQAVPSSAQITVYIPGNSRDPAPSLAPDEEDAGE